METKQYLKENLDDLQKAVVYAYVNDKEAIVSLINKYGGNITKQSTNLDVLVTLEALSQNADFSTELYNFLLKYGYYTNTDANEFSNFAAAIAAAIPALGEIAGNLTAQIGAGKERLLEQRQISSANTQAMLTYMAEQEKAKSDKEKNKVIIIAVVLVAVAGIGALLIFKS